MKQIWLNVSANLVLDKMNLMNLCGGRVVGGGREEEDLELGATPDPGAGGRLTRAPVRDQPEGRGGLLEQLLVHIPVLRSTKSTST